MLFSKFLSEICLNNLYSKNSPAKSNYIVRNTKQNYTHYQRAAKTTKALCRQSSRGRRKRREMCWIVLLLIFFPPLDYMQILSTGYEGQVKSLGSGQDPQSHFKITSSSRTWETKTQEKRKPQRGEPEIHVPISPEDFVNSWTYKKSKKTKVATKMVKSF